MELEVGPPNTPQRPLPGSQREQLPLNIKGDIGLLDGAVRGVQDGLGFIRIFPVEPVRVQFPQELVLDGRGQR